MGNVNELGKFKEQISKLFYNNANIKELLLDGEEGNPKSQRILFKDRVKSHLFIDDTITESYSYIFYDILMPNISDRLKDIKIVVYAISHRDILDTYSKEGYFGNRSDVLASMVEECLLGESVVNKFGIGKLQLKRINIYNSKKLYGRIMEFEVDNFR